MIDNLRDIFYEANRTGASTYPSCARVCFNHRLPHSRSVSESLVSVIWRTGWVCCRFVAARWGVGDGVRVLLVLPWGAGWLLKACKASSQAQGIPMRVPRALLQRSSSLSGVRTGSTCGKRFSQGTPAWQPSSDIPDRVCHCVHPAVPLLCSLHDRERTPPQRMSLLQAALAASMDGNILPPADAYLT